MHDKIITWYLFDPQSFLHSVGLINFNVHRYTMIELGHTSTLSPPCQSVSSMTAPCICLNASYSDEKTAPSLTHWAGFTSFPMAFQVLLEQPYGVTWRRLENEYNPFSWKFPNPTCPFANAPCLGLDPVFHSFPLQTFTMYLIKAKDDSICLKIFSRDPGNPCP